MPEIVYPLVAQLSLSLFFYAVASEWPSSYSTAKSVVEERARRGLTRYLLLRLVPVLFGAVFVAVMVQRSGGEVALSVLGFGLLHLGVTNGRAMFGLLRGRPTKVRRGQLLLLHGIFLALASLAIFAGYRLHGRLDSFVPASEEFIHSIWTGVFAALLAVAGIRMTQAVTEPPNIEAIKRDVGSQTWHYIETAAEENNCDANVLMAVIAAEVQQRPRWFRRAERIKGRLVKNGSYGVAQMTATRPISDFESIDLLAQSFAGYFPDRDPEHGSILAQRFEIHLSRHNSSRSFLDAAMNYYWMLHKYVIESTEARGHDGLAVIEVTDITVSHKHWKISGSAIAYEANLELTWRAMDGTLSDTVAVQVSRAGPMRGDWSVEVPFASCEAWLQEPNVAGSPDTDRRVRVDLMR